MNNLPKNKDFKYGFKLGLALFLAAQIISFFSCLISTARLNTTPGISVHSFWDIGFPFSMYYGMFDYAHGDFDLKGLVGNLLFAIIFSLTVGLIFKFESKPKSAIKNKTFIFGFCIGIICLLSLNCYSFLQRFNAACFACKYAYGFPLNFIVQTNAFISFAEISWNAVIANVLIAVIFGFYVGLIFKFVWEKLMMKKLR